MLTQYLNGPQASTEEGKPIVDNVISTFLKIYISNPDIFSNEEEGNVVL